jgi:hypothetical protein
MVARAQTQPSTPSFAEAKSRRQKVRSAGLNPNYWYPLGYSADVPVGKVIEAEFWGESIAVYRGADGAVRAMDNRCAHRQLKLSLGVVEDCKLVCVYHGWKYNGDGNLAEVDHDLFGKQLPQYKQRTYPTAERYGLIWGFMGDPARANERSIPHIPELEGSNPWPHVHVDFTWNAHHSMIIDNVSDFTHAYLHRRFRPFTDAKLTRLEAVGDKVYVDYDSKIGRGRFSGLFVDRKNVDTDAIKLCYDYPYQWSNTGDKIKHWCFLSPISERQTRVFFVFYFAFLKIPLVPVKIPRRVMDGVMAIAKRTLVKPLLEEDGLAVEAEQEGYEAKPDAPMAEINPCIRAFQNLTIRKWEEHLSGGAAPMAMAEAQA